MTMDGKSSTWQKPKDCRSVVLDFKERIYINKLWKSCNKRTCNHIDHISINNKNASNIQQVRSSRTAECYSDHILVGAKFEIKLKRAF